jgi:hypothetical protein
MLWREASAEMELKEKEALINEAFAKLPALLKNYTQFSSLRPLLNAQGPKDEP